MVETTEIKRQRKPRYQRVSPLRYLGVTSITTKRIEELQRRKNIKDIHKLLEEWKDAKRNT